MRRYALGVVAVLLVVSAVGVIGVGETTAHVFDDSDSAGLEQSQPPSDLEQPETARGGLERLQFGSSESQIDLRTTLNRTPKRAGEFTATTSVGIPDRVTELTLRIPEAATVLEMDGFSESADRTYEWDGRTAEPSVRYRLPADEQINRDGPLAEDGDLRFAGTNEWALVRIPSVGANWRYTGGGEMTADRRTEIDGEGVAGERMAFLGAYDEHTHSAHGQQFRLIVPEAATLAESPERIFESLSRAANRLQVGDRDPEVFIIAAPTEGIEWGVSGLQGGSADMWVGDDERVGTPTNVWVHEYVHTRQDYETTDETEWFTEASATYYAALLGLEEGHISFEEFRRYLADGEAEPHASAVLSDPQSWDNNAEYRKGPLVAGEIDRLIRLTTESESSFDVVFRSLNSHSGELTAVDFERYVSAAGNAEVADHASRYTTTAERPSMWDSDQHAAAFDQTPARVVLELDDEPLTVTGVDGTTTADPQNLTITTGQTVTVRLTATNIGGTVGEYTLPFAVGNESSTETGRLQPNQTATHEFAHTFDEPGVYTIEAGDDRIDLTVEPADTTVSDVPVDVEVPGFGLSAAVVAILLSLIAAHRGLACD